MQTMMNTPSMMKFILQRRELLGRRSVRGASGFDYSPCLFPQKAQDALGRRSSSQRPSTCGADLEKVRRDETARRVIRTPSSFAHMGSKYEVQMRLLFCQLRFNFGHMPELVTDCPRCASRQITFDLLQVNFTGEQLNRRFYEAFCVCRHCRRATIFRLRERESGKDPFANGLVHMNQSVNLSMEIEGFISRKDEASISPPEYLPKDIEAAFKEGAVCKAVGCYNAAATMFRLCVDLATCSLLPKDEVKGLNATVRRNLGLRLPWLFDNDLLPESLRELSTCIKDDGNDGAHAGTLKRSDADDLLDFIVAMLERMYTEPERLRLAKERKEARRTGPKQE